MTFNRRNAIAGIGAAAAFSAMAGSAVPAFAKPFRPSKGARSRVIMVNDLGGDFDGLFAAAHAVMSPSIDLRAIVSANASETDQSAAHGMALGKEMLQLMGASNRVRLIEGASSALAGDGPVQSAGTQFIIDEAMRSDTDLPLFVAVGGGLTELASALMIAPEIGKKITLVWIGGGTPGEYNFLIDPLAAMHVFNDSSVKIWQVNADLYATCQVSMTELQAYVEPHGKVGAWLYERALSVDELLKNYPINPGETWSMGDSPLVLLTALGDFAGRMGDNIYEDVVTPALDAKGVAEPRTSGRKMRVYSALDTRLMFADFYAKLKVNYGR